MFPINVLFPSAVSTLQRGDAESQMLLSNYKTGRCYNPESGWIGLCCRKQWQVVTAMGKWKEVWGAGDVCFGTCSDILYSMVQKLLWRNLLIHLLSWRWRQKVSPKCWYLSMNVYGASSPEYRSINFNCYSIFTFYKGVSRFKLACKYRRTVGEWHTLRANSLFFRTFVTVVGPDPQCWPLISMR
jgi:hypothetical protein